MWFVWQIKYDTGVHFKALNTWRLTWNPRFLWTRRWCLSQAESAASSAWGRGRELAWCFHHKLHQQNVAPWLYQPPAQLWIKKNTENSHCINSSSLSRICTTWPKVLGHMFNPYMIVEHVILTLWTLIFWFKAFQLIWAAGIWSHFQRQCLIHFVYII